MTSVILPVIPDGHISILPVALSSIVLKTYKLCQVFCATM